MLKVDKEKLLKSETFCMIPFVHLHGSISGNVKPCCRSDNDSSIGNLKDNTLEELWNSSSLRQIRLNMLNGSKSDSCRKCYELESTGAITLRQDSLKNFAQYFNVVETTQPDGTVEDMNLKYLDLRFSNVCNFKCRSCGPFSSSRWHSDMLKIRPDKFKNQTAIIRPTEDPEVLWRQLEGIVSGLDEIYFAGGEPLIMEEHYRILKILDDKNLHHVRLRYNTNFSEMKFKGQDVMEIWKNFQDVNVGASLDGSYARGEYIRKEQDWSRTVENRENMIKICPEVEFFISATISLMNVHHIPDFHKEWYELGLIGIDDFHTNILLFPDHLRTQVLPRYMKDRITQKFSEYEDYLSSNNSDKTIILFRSIIKFMNQQDMSSGLPKLRQFMGILDRIRDEDFLRTFPELENLFDEI